MEPDCSKFHPHVLAYNNRPAVLGEPFGVMTDEANKMCNPLYYPNEAQDEAYGYYLGICEYYGTTSVGTSFTAVGGPGVDTLRWEESDPYRVVSYAIERSNSCWGPGSVIAVISSQDPAYTPDNVQYTYIDQTVAYARTYYYRLLVVDESPGANATPWVLPPANPPGAPTNLTAMGSDQGNGVGTVALNRSAASGNVSGYYVFRSAYDGMPNCSATHDMIGTATGTTYQDAGVPTGVPLFYRVMAFNATGSSDVSNEASVGIQPVVSADGAKPSLVTRIELVGANPGREGAAIHFSLAKAGNVRITVYDVAGRRVAVPVNARYGAGDYRVKWDGAASGGQRAAAGVYFVRLWIDGAAFGQQRLVLLR